MKTFVLLGVACLFTFSYAASGCGGYIYVSTATTITLPNSTSSTTDCVWDLKAPYERVLMFYLPNPAQLAQSLQIHDAYTTRTFFSAELPSTTSLSTVYSSPSVVLRFNPRLSTTSTPITVAPAVNCPAGIGSTFDCKRVMGDGSCHCATFVSRTWPASRDLCYYQGMRLVSFETQAEERAIEAAWTNAYLRSGFWTSGSNDGLSYWVWTATGQRLTYTNWYPGTPDNYGGTQHYIIKNFPWNGGDSRWDDMDSMGYSYAICEANP